VNIRHRKLAKDVIDTLRCVPVGVCKPYDVLVAPVYVYLPRNGKFVAIKLPLQYFTPQDLEKFKPYESFYLPEFVDQVLPFQKAGGAIQSLFEVIQKRPVKTSTGTEMVAVPLAQYELDDAVLHILAPLWSVGSKVEPFFLCFFANEVCLPFSTNFLTESADKENFELALLRASTGVFLALHLGYTDPGVLTRLRDRFFSDTLDGVRPVQSPGEVALLQQLIWTLIPNSEVKDISLPAIEKLLKTSGTGGKAAKKLISRLKRMTLNFIQSEAESASLYGEKGICNV
jgi:hypothetical protein